MTCTFTIAAVRGDIGQPVDELQRGSRLSRLGHSLSPPTPHGGPHRPPSGFPRPLALGAAPTGGLHAQGIPDRPRQVGGPLRAVLASCGGRSVLYPMDGRVYEAKASGVDRWRRKLAGPGRWMRT